VVVADLDRIERSCVIVGREGDEVGVIGAANDKPGQSERQRSVVRLVAREDLPFADCWADWMGANRDG
jgi:hypothetical protein